MIIAKCDSQRRLLGTWKRGPDSRSMCHLKCVGPYGVHVSPKMCGTLWCPCVTWNVWAPMHPLKKSTSKSMTKWCKINEHLRGWVPLERCWLKMTPPWSHLGARWPRGSIFHWFFESFWVTKMLQNRWKKEVIFRRPRKPCFLRWKISKAPKWSSKSYLKSSFFWNLTKLQNRAPARTRS